jgi:hypothetical protein
VVAGADTKSHGVCTAQQQSLKTGGCRVAINLRGEYTDSTTFIERHKLSLETVSSSRQKLCQKSLVAADPISCHQSVVLRLIHWTATNLNVLLYWLL